MDEENGNVKQSGTRRRGKVLEDAILEAAWDELREAGYNRLTMESVAARAKTNKAVVYRRWENKAMLVVMVLRKYVLPMIPREVPDTGSLRDDVYRLLSGLGAPLRIVGAETLHGLMADMIGKVLSASMQREHESDTENTLLDGMMTILKNAEKRGEVIAEKVPRRVAMLPLDLFRFEIFIHRAPISDETVREIVDDVFMPLVVKR
ncbi:transcriptional regulator, TetR family [Sporobacter termitidis DSM 10068]|uniref:Transcriptional regulator, TetR family n=1 Tax=Sporobacter termitidis DSM 10068 TaxID=1123282 RepID=A0A1M5XP83_9FIRM|nr:TetR/AcrR family transcriptional regulator [Sporobacter termitidis]SHI01611.1 transcriptional regulator, TetR family [Sporobacter termitidis DSM 10068]